MEFSKQNGEKTQIMELFQKRYIFPLIVSIRKNYSFIFIAIFYTRNNIMIHHKLY